MTTDIEVTTERRIESASKHALASNKELFVAGYQAHKVYGLYQENATLEIARRAGRSVSAVQSWVDAYRCFTLCYETNPSAAVKLRRKLTMTHFKRMWEARQQFDLPGGQCLYFLALMVGYKENGERYGPDELTNEIMSWARAVGLAPDRAVDWHWHWERLQKPLELLASFDGDLPPEIKVPLSQLVAQIKKRY